MPQPNYGCAAGDHRFFVAEVIGVESEGMAHILIVCTSCGQSHDRSHKVASPGTPLRLLQEEKKTRKDS